MTRIQCYPCLEFIRNEALEHKVAEELLAKLQEGKPWPSGTK